MINDESQGSIAEHLSYDGYKFIIKFAGHLAKLQVKWFIVSDTLHLCPQTCRTRQINKITSV